MERDSIRRYGRRTGGGVGWRDVGNAELPVKERWISRCPNDRPVEVALAALPLRLLPRRHAHRVALLARHPVPAATEDGRRQPVHPTPAGGEGVTWPTTATGQTAYSNQD